MNKKTVTAIIVAAGNSTRFGQNKNKNFKQCKTQRSRKR